MQTVAQIMITAAITIFIVMLITRYRKARKANATKVDKNRKTPTLKTKNLETATLHLGIINQRPASMSFAEYRSYLRYQKKWLKERLSGQLVYESSRYGSARKQKKSAKP